MSRGKDIAIGAPGESANQGEVYIFNSSGSSGFTNGTTFTNADRRYTGPAGSGFGRKLAVGDINDGGTDDIVVSGGSDVVDLDGAGTGAAGQIWLVVEFPASDTDGTLGFPTITGSAANNENIGWTLAVFDWNGDGVDDVFFSVPEDNDEAATQTDEVRVINGADTITGTTPATLSVSQTFTNVEQDEPEDSLADGDPVVDGWARFTIASVADGNEALVNCPCSYILNADVNGDGTMDILFGMDDGAAYIAQP